MQKFPLLLGLLALISADAACALDEPADTDAEPAVADDEVFYETVVTTLPDGSSQVGEPVAITAGEERRQNEARRAFAAGDRAEPSLTVDAGCAGTSFWLYSRTDFVGERVCFRGTGQVFLQFLSRYVYINGKPYYAGTWEIRTGSGWAGEDFGAIGGALRLGPFSQEFSPYAQFVLADHGYAFRYLKLGV